MQLSAALLMAGAGAVLVAAVPAPNNATYHAGPRRSSGGFAGVRVGRQSEQPTRSVNFLADVVPVIADRMELDHAAYGDDIHHCTSTGLCTVTPVAKEDGDRFNAVGLPPFSKLFSRSQKRHVTPLARSCPG